MLWDIMSKQRMNIFKGDSKKLPSGKTNFPFASISTSWNFWRKTLFWGIPYLSLFPLYISQKYVPIQSPKKDRHPPSVSPTWRGAPVNFVSMTSYFNLLASQTSVFFGTTNNVVRPPTPGGNKNIGNFQYRWRKSENRWLSFFFVCFWCFCFDSWKLYWWMFSFLFGSFRWNFRWCASWRTKLSLRVTKHILWLKKIKQ